MSHDMSFVADVHEWQFRLSPTFSITKARSRAYLPTPLAAFRPAELPEREEEPLLACPAPMDQSLLPREELWPGRGVVSAWRNMPTWRDMLSSELNQSSISRVGSKPAGQQLSVHACVATNGFSLAEYAHLAKHAVDGAELPSTVLSASFKRRWRECDMRDMFCKS